MRMTQKKTVPQIALLAALIWPIASIAVPVKWIFSNAVFDDGGMATGSFIYDADVNDYSNIAITTSAGSSFAGSFYFTDIAAFRSASFLGPLDSLAADLGAAGAHSMSLFFVGGLSNSGGVVPLLTLAPGPGGTINGSRENLCDPGSATCAGSSGIRGFLQGAAVVSVAVSEPTSLAVLLLGAAVAGFTRSRWG